MGSLLTKWAGILFIYSAPARVQTAQGAGCFIVFKPSSKTLEHSPVCMLL